MALPGSASHRLLGRIALFARRRYHAIFAVTAVVVLAASFLVSRLEFDTDVLALLPKNDPAVEAFRDALETFGSVDYLLVVVRIPEGALLEPYEAFVGELGDRLVGLEQFLEVEYKLGDLEEMLATLLPAAPLFLEPAQLEELGGRLTDERLEQRAKELKRLVSTPQSLATKNVVKLDPLGFSSLFLDRVAAARSGLAVDWSSGYLLSRDHRMLLMLAKPVRPPQDVDFSREMLAALEAQIADLESEWPEFAGPEIPIPEVEVGGRYVIGLGDAELIKKDVIANVVTSAIGVLALFLFAFRRLGALAYAFVPLFCGLVLTFGFSAIAFGGLSSATSGTAALLIGLGIDFVIVSYGRFVEERERGGTLEQGLASMSGSSGRAVVVGAVTSAATFYAFGVTDFTGLYQMGFLTGTGILFCMVAVLLLLPAMLAWNEDHHSRRQSRPRLYLHGFGSSRLIRFSVAHPKSMLTAGTLITVAAGIAALGVRFEDSVSTMRPRGNRAVELREEVANRFGFGFDQMMLVIDGQDFEETLDTVDHAASGAQRLVDEGILTGVDSIGSMLPPLSRQQASLRWLAERRAAGLDPERVRTLFEDALAREGLRLEPFKAGLDLSVRALERDRPIAVEELEDSSQAAGLLGRYLKRTENGWKSAIYLHPPPRVWRRAPPPAAVALAEELGPHVTLTGANVVSEVLRREVLVDARLATALGFVLVTILLWIDYRRIWAALLSLVPLIMGIIWMLGSMALLDIPMNFMNIFVTTMIIGIGVDYGIHMIHRYRECAGSSPEVLNDGMVETGKAIMLAALSTIVGFGSLSRSSYPGLSSMGLVAILGAVATCLVAITVLPAYLSLRKRTGTGTNVEGWRNAG
jgi:predicted RND superfamily exporter protein